MNNWISVKDRIPTEKDATDGYIFVCREQNGEMIVEVSLLDVVIKYPDLYDFWSVMIFPEPPKENEK